MKISPKISSKKKKGKERKKKRQVRERGNEVRVRRDWEDGFPHFDDGAKFSRILCGVGNCPEQRRRYGSVSM